MTKNTVPDAGVRAHYLSPRRRDPVKIMMEEMVSRRVFADAVHRLGLPQGQVLRVLDLGCGIGDGYTLLTDAHQEVPPVTADHRVQYVGLDADPDMIETAASLHPRSTTAFHTGDIRDELPGGHFDLYLSCGVPYSYLTSGELTEVLAGIFGRIADTGRKAAVVVDVLGRYSVEWRPNWHTDRWDYAMTFLEDTTERLEQPMTFYDRSSLSAAIAAAAQHATAAPRVPEARLKTSFTDRSILVGRHTATRAFNPSIPAYRTMVNELARGSAAISVADLRFEPPTSGAPQEILAFFQRLAKRWNAVLHRAATVAARDQSPGAHGPSLAAELLRCETQEQRGLGVGHSLTATVVVDATR